MCIFSLAVRLLGWIECSFLVLYNEKDIYPSKCVACVFEKIVTVSLILQRKLSPSHALPAHISSCQSLEPKILDKGIRKFI